ncbi:MAG: hypothetical protein FWF72_02575 [Paludibacter sp.]|nr:hypothetical protein [Paludibacter sp.]
MLQNYLWSQDGIKINAFMVATAWSLKKMMEKLKVKFLQFICRLFLHQNFYYLAA